VFIELVAKAAKKSNQQHNHMYNNNDTARVKIKWFVAPEQKKNAKGSKLVQGWTTSYSRSCF